MVSVILILFLCSGCSLAIGNWRILWLNFACFLRELNFPIHSYLPVMEYSLVTPIVAILNENPVCYTTYLYSTYIVLHTQIIIYIIMYHMQRCLEKSLK